MNELRSFFFNVLELEINQTPSHRTGLPMKKNQSLSYSIDLDLNLDLYKDLTKFVTIYRFMEFEKINPELASISSFFPQYGKKPVPFRIVIDKDFENLYYDYSKDNLYTFMNFEFNSKKFNLPIEKISL